MPINPSDTLIAELNHLAALLTGISMNSDDRRGIYDSLSRLRAAASLVEPVGNPAVPTRPDGKPYDFAKLRRMLAEDEDIHEQEMREWEETNPALAPITTKVREVRTTGRIVDEMTCRIHEGAEVIDFEGVLECSEGCAAQNVVRR